MDKTHFDTDVVSIYSVTSSLGGLIKTERTQLTQKIRAVRAAGRPTSRVGIHTPVYYCVVSTQRAPREFASLGLCRLGRTAVTCMMSRRPQGFRTHLVSESGIGVMDWGTVTGSTYIR